MKKKEDLHVYKIHILRVRNNVQARMIIIIIYRFYTALFSALEQTHCARM